MSLTSICISLWQRVHYFLEGLKSVICGAWCLRSLQSEDVSGQRKLYCPRLVQGDGGCFSLWLVEAALYFLLL